MPFPRTLKASLVALVLTILTAVPRLDAAPMNFENIGQGAMRFVEGAGNEAGFRVSDTSAFRRVQPGEQPQRGLINPAGGFQISPTSAFHPVQPGEQLQRGPVTDYPYSTFGDQHWPNHGYGIGGSNHGYGMGGSNHGYGMGDSNHGYGMDGSNDGYGTVGSSYAGQEHYQGVSMDPHHPGWGQNVNDGHAGFETGSSSSVGNEGHYPATSGGSRSAMSRSNSVRNAGDPRGNPPPRKNILKILRDDRWPTLSLKRRSDLLNGFAEKAFTLKTYEEMSQDPKWKRDFRDMSRKLVERYLEARLELLAGVEGNKALRFKWLQHELDPTPFLQTARKGLGRPQTANSITQSAMDPVNGDPFRPFRLGEYIVRVIGEDSTGEAMWSNLNKNEKKKKPTIVNVGAFPAVEGKDMYIGRAKISLE